MNNDLQKIIEFIIELDKLKSILRKTKPVGLDRYENSAEHSWQVCMLALMLSQHALRPINIVRVVEILLVHDIPEIYAGDQIVYQAQSQERQLNELASAQRVFGLLPETQKVWCMSRWQEYESKETNESAFAYAIDRLMPVLHNLHNNGQSWRENKVPLEKILKVNAVIGEEIPDMWIHVQKLIGEFIDVGVFSYD